MGISTSPFPAATAMLRHFWFISFIGLVCGGIGDDISADGEVAMKNLEAAQVKMEEKLNSLTSFIDEELKKAQDSPQAGREYRRRKREAPMQNPLLAIPEEGNIEEEMQMMMEDAEAELAGNEEEEAAPEAEKEESPVEDVEDPSEAVEEQGEDYTDNGADMRRRNGNARRRNGGQRRRNGNRNNARRRNGQRRRNGN